jgi:molybdenum cofactor guanylyltransferase
MGRPKAWLPLGSEPMLCRVVRLLRESVDVVVVVAAPGQDMPPLPSGVPILRDAAQGRGPLQGLAAGLRGVSDQLDAAYVSSCDVPFLRPAFVGRLFELLGKDAICVPRIGAHYHSLAAVYRPEVLAHVETLLAEDQLRPFFLFARVPTRVVEAAELIDVDPDFQSLRNLNTWEDYQAALREL